MNYERPTIRCTGPGAAGSVCPNGTVTGGCSRPVSFDVGTCKSHTTNNTDMKIPEALQTKEAENAFTVALFAAIFFIIPCIPFPGKIWGGVAILALCVIGMVTYITLFRERHDWRKMAFAAALAGGVATAGVIAIWLWGLTPLWTAYLIPGAVVAAGVVAFWLSRSWHRG